MNRVHLESLSEDKTFKIKLEAYLYLTAKKMELCGKGDRSKLRKYMEQRVAIIQEITGVGIPFSINENGEEILEVKT